METLIKSTEPTEAEITAAGNDYFAAKLRKQVAAGQVTAAQSTDKSADGWMIEPTDEMILSDLARRGEIATPSALVVCRERLRKELVDDFKIIQAAMPTAADEVKEAAIAATEAQARSESIFLEHRGALDALETIMISFLQVHTRISTVQTLQILPASERDVAFSTIRSYTIALESPCNLHTSSFESQLRDFALRKCISPYIPEYVKPLEAQATNLAAEIRDMAKTQRVNLKVVIQSLDKRIKLEPGNFQKGIDGHRLYDLLNDQS